jgi:hypothetical protein
MFCDQEKLCLPRGISMLNHLYITLLQAEALGDVILYKTMSIFQAAVNSYCEVLSEIIQCGAIMCEDVSC